MSGKELSEQDKKLESFKGKLDDLMERVQLNHTDRFVNPNSEAAIYLSYAQISSMEGEALIESAFMLRQYNLNLQKDINKFTNICKWCKTQLNDQIIKTDDSNVYSYDLKVANTVAQNSYAEKLQKLITYYESYKEQLSGMTHHVGKMADTLEALGKNRCYSRGR